LECGDSSPLWDFFGHCAAIPLRSSLTQESKSGDESPHSKESDNKKASACASDSGVPMSKKAPPPGQPQISRLS
jgi:hypothetical protein